MSRPLKSVYASRWLVKSHMRRSEDIPNRELTYDATLELLRSWVGRTCEVEVAIPPPIAHLADGTSLGKPTYDVASFNLPLEEVRRSSRDIEAWWAQFGSRKRDRWAAVPLSRASHERSRLLDESVLTVQQRGHFTSICDVEAEPSGVDWRIEWRESWAQLGRRLRGR